MLQYTWILLLNEKGQTHFYALSKLTISSFSKPSSLPQSLSSRPFYTVIWEVIPWSPTSAPGSKILRASSQYRPESKLLYIFLLYTSPNPTLLHPHTPSVHPSWTHHIFLSHLCLLFTLIVLPETPWNALYLCLSYPWFKAVFSFINLFLISKPCFLPCWKLIALSYWKKHTLHLL